MLLPPKRTRAHSVPRRRARWSRPSCRRSRPPSPRSCRSSRARWPATLALFAEGNTLPFVARYRKEATGGLDETQLRAIQERSEYLRELAERRAAIRKSIDEQGKLTPELAARLDAVATKQGLEDLYLPYKPKRRTRATIARERGLEPLADAIWSGALDDAAVVAAAAGYVRRRRRGARRRTTRWPARATS